MPLSKEDVLDMQSRSLIHATDRIDQILADPELRENADQPHSNAFAIVIETPTGGRHSETDLLKLKQLYEAVGWDPVSFTSSPEDRDMIVRGYGVEDATESSDSNIVTMKLHN